MSQPLPQAAGPDRRREDSRASLVIRDDGARLAGAGGAVHPGQHNRRLARGRLVLRRPGPSESPRGLRFLHNRPRDLGRPS